MKTSLRTLRLAWPREVTVDQVAGAMRLLAALAGTPAVLEALGRYGRVEHRIRVPEGRAPAVTSQLRATIPGLGIEGVHKTEPSVYDLAMELRLSTRRRSLDTDQSEATNRTLLHALAAVGRNEAVLLQWLLTDQLSPVVVPSKIESLPAESFTRALLTAPFALPGPADADTRTALRDKQSEPGWRAVGRIAVQAATAGRRQQLVNTVLGALRTAEAPGVRIGAKTVRTSRVARVAGHGRLRLNVSELATVCAWAVGDTNAMPVIRLGSRRLPTPAAIPTAGRVVGAGTWPGRKRVLALSSEDSLRHLHLLGPTGTGKSTLLLNLILQDIRAGRGLVVVDPKSDLISDILERVPAERVDDIVVLDPTDTSRPVGLNSMAVGGRSPDLAADHLLEVFHSLYAANWGPRTSDILGASLLTLARLGGMSLVAVPPLLTDPGFRRRLVGRLDDPVGLGPFWASYEAWSEAERTTAIAPVLNKLRPFLMRSGLRRIVGLPSPGFQVQQVFTQRKVLLVDLAKGSIGPEAAGLLGALVMAEAWQAAQGRSAIPASKRHPVNVYLDEFQDYLHLPTNLADALAQARGLGVGFTLAHQHFGQLSPSMKAAVLANARSRISFQLGSDDAKALATTSTILAAEDFSGLDTFHFYAQLMAGGKVQPWCSGRSLPASKPSTDANGIRRSSRQRYGVGAAEIDEALLQLVGGRRKSSTDQPDDLAPRRRTNRKEGAA